MSRNIPCSMAKLTGCQGIVSQRGTILCDNCIEKRKSMSKMKRDQNIDEMITRNKELERMCQQLQEKVKTLSTQNNNHSSDYSVALEKENTRLSEVVVRLRSEIETLVKEKAEYEMTHSQVRLDNEKLSRDNIRLEKLNTDLHEQNELLMKEIQISHESLTH